MLQRASSSNGSGRFRFVHYAEGGKHGPHIDGREPVRFLRNAVSGSAADRIELDIFFLRGSGAINEAPRRVSGFLGVV